jgi:glycosyltransferase involved in cell wall biosynthesis
VIIPVHNGERYLAEAIQSALAQTLPPAEIIVIDDGSTDGSTAIAQSFGPPVRVLTQPNLGPAAARNLGVQHATGEPLAFLDGDDLWLPEKLAYQAQFLVDNPSCQALFGRMENFITPELDERQAALLAKSAAQSGEMHVGTLLIHRTTFLRVGYFDTGRRHGEFIDWWGRARQLGLTYAILPELVMRRRLHADNLTRREQDGRREYLALLRQNIARQRETASAGAETT